MAAAKRKAKKSARKKSPAKKKSAKKSTKRPVKKSAKKAPKKKAVRGRKTAKPKKPTKKAPARKSTKVKKAVRARPVAKPEKTEGTSPSMSAAVAPTLKPVTFVLDAPTAWDVAIAGSFSNWEPKAMTKGSDGFFRITMSLKPGQYLYKFLIDTEWHEDPKNPDRQVNELGGYNSILHVPE